jgi:hypothetical protein
VEISDLSALEKIVDAGMTSFVETGCALRDIRDRKLWRGAYDSFDAYCNGRFSIKQRQANRIIDASETVESFEANRPKNTIDASEARFVR